MAKIDKIKKKTSGRQKPGIQSIPPGRLKISEALKILLKEKNFDAITWAEIAEMAGVNEALIYKYFGDKRNLLHAVLKEYLSECTPLLRQSLQDVEGVLEKIRVFIHVSLSRYLELGVLARILIVEVRTFPGYFQSGTYEEIRNYSDILLKIIEDGVREGKIRNDIPPRLIRQMILGTMEYMCLPMVLFKQKLDPDEVTDQICKFVFSGIKIQKVKKRPMVSK